jgi:hypothetical protein
MPPPSGWKASRHWSGRACSGLADYDISYVNATDLHTVDKPRVRRTASLEG